MIEKVRYSDDEKRISVEAFTDGYAYDQYSRLYLLSVAGYDSSVRAITSAFLSWKSVDILTEKPISLSKGYAEKYRVLSTKVGNGLLHQIVLADNFFNSSRGDKLLYIDNEKQTPEIIYNSIKKSYSVPLIPEWSLWLYRRLAQENCLEELRGTKKVIRLNADEEKLDSIVSEGVKNNEISF
ncbi:MAG: hypothetical protein WC614_07145 [bacterium]